ncbi:MAG: NAD(P)-binding domain-containing protein [Actinomycetota bacterium]|nr:NAD(P)-binding domain-containing protein [Actinomycetota bacterium]
MLFPPLPTPPQIISLNKVHSPADDPEIRLRWDWNSLLNDSPELLFYKYSREYFPDADDMLHYLADFHRKHALNVRFATRVDRVEKAGGQFIVHTAEQILRAQCVIVAPGWGGPHVPTFLALSWPSVTRPCPQLERCSLPESADHW